MEEQLKLTRSQWFKVVVALAVVLAVSACGKKKAAPPPPPPPPSAPAPTASLTANPNALNAGQATTLIWKTDYATSVTIDQLGKVDPSGSSTVTLAADARFLKQHPNMKFTVEGHCDERGSTEYNLALGDNRANSTKQALVSLGISGDRIRTISYGKEKPFCTESTEACWAQNRRAHFVYQR